MKRRNLFGMVKDCDVTASGRYIITLKNGRKYRVTINEELNYLAVSYVQPLWGNVYDEIASKFVFRRSETELKKHNLDRYIRGEKVYLKELNTVRDHFLTVVLGWE